MAVLPDVINSEFSYEPASGTYEVCSREEALPDEHVRRVDLEVAQGSRLDELCHKMGIIRVGTRGGILDLGPMVETDVALRNRAIAYGEDWGLLDDEEEQAAQTLQLLPELSKLDIGRISSLQIHAGGVARVIVENRGTILVDGQYGGTWPELPRMLDEIAGTDWELRTVRGDHSIVVPGIRGLWDIVLGDDGSRRGVHAGESEELAPKDVAELLYAIVAEKHAEMRVHRLGRALFESEPAVVKLVGEVTDVRAHDRRGVGISPERTRAAFEKAWSRDEGGLRTVCLARARQVLHRLGDAVCIPRGGK